MTSQDAYREFCQGRNDLSLFMQPFWLDLTCDPGTWDVVFSKHAEGSIRGAWAFRHGTKLGMRWIRLPILTPFTAIWIEDLESESRQKQISHRHEIMTELEAQLPKAQIVEVKLPWTIQDWLPLYWNGYRQETRYTFRFAETHTDIIHDGFSKSYHRNLRASEKHFTIEDGAVGDLYRMMEHVMEMREALVIFPQHKLEQIITTLQQRQQCKIYAARDAEGVQAIALMVWDSRTTYYLIGGRSRTDSKNGMSLLIWQAIQDAALRGHAFDFEGSMIKGVNRFFQNFGAQLTPYHYIYRYRGLARVKYL